jgi:hypothetical protein
VARGKSVEAAARELAAQPGVVFAEPNYFYCSWAMRYDPLFVGRLGLLFFTDSDFDGPEA